jgi:Zn-dependent M28 family amino/carboxypeptidase
VDTQRTPIIFKTPRWIATYQVLTTAAFGLWLVQVVLYPVGTVTQWTWIWPVTILSALGSLYNTALGLHAERTPFSPGANDNASGAGLVLTLAERLQAEPLAHTRVWLACTGCEESQHYGAADFYQRHVGELHFPVSVVFEFLGCAGPAWLTKEGIVIPFHADRDLVALARELSAEHPEWGAYPARINGGNTEMADALRAGVPAITLVGMGPRGEVPYVHQVHDTYDKMDPEVMGRAFAFAWAYIQALDARARHRERD